MWRGPTTSWENVGPDAGYGWSRVTGTSIDCAVPGEAAWTTTVPTVAVGWTRTFTGFRDGCPTCVVTVHTATVTPNGNVEPDEGVQATVVPGNVVVGSVTVA